MSCELPAPKPKQPQCRAVIGVIPQVNLEYEFVRIGDGSESFVDLPTLPVRHGEILDSLLIAVSDRLSKFVCEGSPKGFSLHKRDRTSILTVEQRVINSATTRVVFRNHLPGIMHIPAKLDQDRVDQRRPRERFVAP